jgi:hypothetical protein
MTWALLAISVVLNGTVHYLTSTGTAPSWLLVVAVAAVPPTVLGLCVHLAVGMGRPGQLLAQPAGSSTAGWTDGAMEGSDPVAESLAPDPATELVAQGVGRVGRRKLAAELGISEYEARKMLASRNGHADVRA